MVKVILLKFVEIFVYCHTGHKIEENLRHFLKAKFTQEANFKNGFHVQSA